MKKNSLIKKLFVSAKEGRKILDEQKPYKPDAGVFAIGLTKKEIKMLIFWASVGVSKSKGGSYDKVIIKTLRYFSKETKTTLPVTLKFKK